MHSQLAVVSDICSEPIVVFSEQAQEHWNKHVSRYKSGCRVRATQHSVKLNLRDLLARMLQMTHPVVVAKRQMLKCRICGEAGHTARSKLHHNYPLVNALGEDDGLILALYMYTVVFELLLMNL